MARVYTEVNQGQAWLAQYRGRAPIFACVLGFTETGLIPGISAAGATPEVRRYTALADAEFLYHGVTPHSRHPLPPLDAGISPVFISRAVLAGQGIPIVIFNAGLPQPPTVPHVELGGMPARCLRFGNAMNLPVVQHLFQQGLLWGDRLAKQATGGYVILSECVVGGTTTALAILTGLGWDAAGKVNSSHPQCNHQQKWDVVQEGLTHAIQQHTSHQQHRRSGVGAGKQASKSSIVPDLKHYANSPLQLVAAVGDPMQIVVAGMSIAASRFGGVLLAGGTQMLAVYALAQRLVQCHSLSWQPEQIIVGTTRWVAEDPTGDTIGLAELLETPLIATPLSFANSRYHQLRAYEQGYVKEGVGAGGCAIAANLYQGWNSEQLLQAIETLAEAYEQVKVGEVNPRASESV
jgi:NaMN:DMB phosphoribosyltransferase